MRMAKIMDVMKLFDNLIKKKLFFIELSSLKNERTVKFIIRKFAGFLYVFLFRKSQNYFMMIKIKQV